MQCLDSESRPLSRATTNSSLAILYGQNTFNFNINAVAKYSDESKVFGLFADPSRKHLLRDLRRITLHINLNDYSRLAVKRHRERLQQFVQELQKFSHDSQNKSLLKKLKVEWFSTSLEWHHDSTLQITGIPSVARRSDNEIQKDYIFGLEGLTALSGVEDVEIIGRHVPLWLIECLRRCVKGIAKAPLPIVYPELVVKRMDREKFIGAKRTYKYVAVSTKKWCDPLLNWTEFADREGIEIPETDRSRLQNLGI